MQTASALNGGITMWISQRACAEGWCTAAELTAAGRHYAGMTVDWGSWEVPGMIANLAIVGGAAVLALVLHAVAMAIGRRVAARTPDSVDDAAVALSARPLRWIAVALALAIARRFLVLPEWADDLWKVAAGFIVPGLIGWLVVTVVQVYIRAIELRYDIAVEDNLRARRRRTRTAILGRIVIIGVSMVTIALMLLSIPSIRSVGITLMASAGIAGLAVGAAAQPALKNLIAGIQLAFTEPIRIDDVLIIDGEWGKVEEIRLTYVVVALWDERRLVVPVSRFLDMPFQNWTRNTSKLLGSAFFWLDPATDVPRLRAKYEEIIRANPRWDGRAFVLQVTDTKPEAIEIRVLATAKDAPTAFDLRCDIREAMLAFIRDEMPEALPKHRLAPAALSAEPSGSASSA
ncbi:mechanosensitive ion channel family protein [Sphingomonas mucosissima]|uniref:Low conductance mechanosensitive channel YnaI n=1 Tax=Sphingomonas mucosissima TaxID=370959 RepID=A0A245ZSP2_9SPHN|nr:mechanosensitive ion channel domain-containing protein [Sphingomonas mucosissima]OWK32755.1 Low conductance mechanosensitive channel YnaI [Sphingomonas mucosissima]